MRQPTLQTATVNCRRGSVKPDKGSLAANQLGAHHYFSICEWPFDLAQEHVALLTPRKPTSSRGARTTSRARTAVDNLDRRAGYVIVGRGLAEAGPAVDLRCAPATAIYHYELEPGMTKTKVT